MAAQPPSKSRRTLSRADNRTETCLRSTGCGNGMPMYEVRVSNVPPHAIVVPRRDDTYAWGTVQPRVGSDVVMRL